MDINLPILSKNTSILCYIMAVSLILGSGYYGMVRDYGGINKDIYVQVQNNLH